jgi:tetratricopeptide (TPR) repeat protein
MRPSRLVLPFAFTLSIMACKDAPPTASRPAPQSGANPAHDPGGALAPIAGDGPTDLAIREAQAAVRRTPGRGRPLLRLAQLFVRKARESSDPGFYQQADDAVARALRLDPNDLAALQIRGLVLMQDHRFGEARDLATRAIARDPEQPIFYGLLGDAEMEVGRYAAAEAAYQRMIDLRPNLASYSRGSWMRWLLGDVDGAIELGRHAVEAGSPRVPEELAWTIVQLGNLYLAKGDLEQAQQNFEAALRVFPGYPTALDARGVVRRLRGDLAGALADATAAVEGATTTEHLVHRGEAQEAASRSAEAAATFAQAERAGRRSDPRTLALFYANHDREHEAAVTLARREVSSRADDVYALDVLAWALLRAGHLDEAATLCDRARRLGTREARFSYHAGMIALALGRRDEATTLLREALRMNPHFDARGADDARRALANLEGRAAGEVRVADR